MPFLEEQAALMKKHNVTFSWEGDYLYVEFDPGVESRRTIEFDYEHNRCLRADDFITKELQ